MSRWTPVWIIVFLGLVGLVLLARSSAPGVLEKDQLSFAFWNVQNLFDTTDDPTHEGDDEMVPAFGWTDDRYRTKLAHLANVIAELSPHILGLAEVENRQVLEDLVRQPALRSLDFRIAHRDSSDARGIDVALLFRKPLLALHGEESVFHHTTPGASRGLLEVRLIADGRPLSVIVLHWPSRRGGEAKSAPRRAQAARALLGLLEAQDPNDDALILGDFNDDPSDASVKNILGATPHRRAVLEDLKERRLYNPTWRLYGELDVGTYYYNPEWMWHLFDQCILSRGMLLTDGFEYVEGSLRIHAPKRIRDEQGRPFWFRQRRNRASGPSTNGPNTTGPNNWTEGYSDHFPIYGRLSVRP